MPLPLIFAAPVPAGTNLPPHLKLMSGMLSDALMLARTDYATVESVDLGMRLGAGYPAGPFELLRAMDPALRAPFGAIPDVVAASTGDAAVAAPWTGPVGLAGTGHMAGGIAEATARSGRLVKVLARNRASFDRMLGRIRKSLSRSVEKGRFSAAEAEAALERIALAGEPSELSDCDLVLEAVKESLDVKRALLSRLEAVLPAHVAVATNTSSFQVSDIASAAPARLVFALHFFNPAQAMKLVELVFPADAPRAVRIKARDFALAIGKTPVFCADARGFLVNRLLIPFLNDAVRAHEDGLSAEDVDRLMTEGAGHPMGPLALIDLIGIDVTIFALAAMAETHADARIAPAHTLRELAAAGRLGRKSGHGFYEYGDKR